MRQGVKMDGEYYLKVRSRILQVRLTCQICVLTHLESTCNHMCTHILTHTGGPHQLCQCVWPQIYCAEMQTDSPKEYVTLRSGQTDNYSEVYGNRCVQR